MPQNVERQVALLALLAGSKKPLSQDSVFKKLPNFYPGRAADKRDTIRKAFARDIEALTSMGVPILAEKMDGGECYRILRDQAGLDENFVLSVEEARRLRRILADPMLAGQLPSNARQTLANLLAFHAPFDLRGEGEDATLDDEGLRVEKLAALAREQRACQIEYPNSHSGDLERRIVSPHGIYARLGNHYLAAVCGRDHFVKVFSVAKIRRVETSNTPYEQAKDFDLAEYAKRNAFLLGGEAAKREAVVEISPEEAWRLKERLPWSVSEERRDGSLLARISVNDPKRFYRFVLSFGPHARIIEPPELRQGLANLLRSAL